jgi:hypothetical protein
MVDAVVLATGLPYEQVAAMTLPEVTDLYWRTDPEGGDAL